MRRSMTRGVSAVEFALTLPVVLIMVAGIIEFGWFVTQTITVSRAARDASRYGAAVYEAPEVTAGTLALPEAEDFANEILTGAGMPCEIGCSIKATLVEDPFELIVVDVSYAYASIFGLVAAPTSIEYSFMTAVEAQ